MLDRRTGQAISEVVLAEEIDLLFDLHEARDYYRLNPTSFGQTLLFNSNDGYVLLAWDIADIINPPSYFSWRDFLLWHLLRGKA